MVELTGESNFVEAVMWSGRLELIPPMALATFTSALLTCVSPRSKYNKVLVKDFAMIHTCLHLRMRSYLILGPRTDYYRLGVGTPHFLLKTSLSLPLGVHVQADDHSDRSRRRNAHSIIRSIGRLFRGNKAAAQDQPVTDGTSETIEVPGGEQQGGPLRPEVVVSPPLPPPR
ncbi:unnamed protein product, partial [Haemonchus placei]|uniref:Uncharacterized protein n=1 Tax=Haemonchus placei TaxID=6290 RepID=A0A0N4VUP8_HAEPC